MASAMVLVAFLAFIPFLNRSIDPQTQRQAAALASPAPAAAGSSAPQATARAAVTPVPTRAGGRLTLTAGGTVAVETNVRRSGYYSAAKKYDFDEVFSLLRSDLQADLTLVTLENLIVPSAKMDRLNVPPEVLRMLRVNGIQTVALGFPGTWSKGTAAVVTTLDAAEEQGLRTLGAFAEEDEADPLLSIREINGIRVALLHYTMTPSNESRKALKKDGRTLVYPLTEQAPGEIARVREAGAQLVVVSVHWGKSGVTKLTQAQRTLAQQMADAGADIILGSGSRCVQTAEWLTGQRKDGSSARVLCAWGLGCLLSDSDKAANTAGMLLHIEAAVDEEGVLTLGEPGYTATYLWHFKLDSADRYRVIRATGDGPDGMTSAEERKRTQAAQRVAETLAGSALQLRED